MRDACVGGQRAEARGELRAWRQPLCHKGQRGWSRPNVHPWLLRPNCSQVDPPLTPSRTCTHMRKHKRRPPAADSGPHSPAPHLARTRTHANTSAGHRAVRGRHPAGAAPLWPHAPPRVLRPCPPAPRLPSRAAPAAAAAVAADGQRGVRARVCVAPWVQPCSRPAWPGQRPRWGRGVVPGVHRSVPPLHHVVLLAACVVILSPLLFGGERPGWPAPPHAAPVDIELPPAAPCARRQLQGRCKTHYTATNTPACRTAAQPPPAAPAGHQRLQPDAAPAPRSRPAQPAPPSPLSSSSSSSSRGAAGFGTSGCGGRGGGQPSARDMD